jgi:hypothetical protein
VSRISTGWSLTKASWAVLRADSSLAVFPALSILCAAVGCELIIALGVVVADGVNVPWVAVPFILAGIYAAIFSVVYFNVALAGAARLSIEGRDTKLRDGLAVARQRRGVIAQWALLQLGLGLLISILGSLLGGGNGGRNPAGNILAVVAGAAWSVASFFVIPLLALEGLGPRAALKRSLALVRSHWGESVAGRVGISGTVFLLAVVPLAGAFVGADALMKTNPTLGGVASGVAVLALVATIALGSALGVIFRVELYHYATAGELTGGFAQQDIDAAFRTK